MSIYERILCFGLRRNCRGDRKRHKSISTHHCLVSPQPFSLLLVIRLLRLFQHSVFYSGGVLTHDISLFGKSLFLSTTDQMLCNCNGHFCWESAQDPSQAYPKLSLPFLIKGNGFLLPSWRLLNIITMKITVKEHLLITYVFKDSVLYQVYFLRARCYLHKPHFVTWHNCTEYSMWSKTYKETSKSGHYTYLDLFS